MTTTKRQTKKHIWDWSDLVEAVREERRMPKQTPISDGALCSARRHLNCRLAQMDERIVACAHETCITLLYFHTPKERDVSDSRLHDWVRVYPAAGGRTTYCIDHGVNGWFANARLPINAADRRTRSQYRSETWHYGSAGVYQAGQGPYYPDVGPDLSNLSLEGLIDMVSASRACAEYKECAISLARRVASAVQPYRDTVLRFEPQGLHPDAEVVDTSHYRLSMYRKDNRLLLSSPYGMNIRLKSPMASGPTGWECVPDFTVHCCGPLNGMQDSEGVWYGVSLMYPNGRNSSTECSSPQWSTGVSFNVTTKSRPVVEAAAQWAASNIRIPVL